MVSVDLRLVNMIFQRTLIYVSRSLGAGHQGVSSSRNQSPGDTFLAAAGGADCLRRGSNRAGPRPPPLPALRLGGLGWRCEEQSCTSGPVLSFSSIALLSKIFLSLPC